jgi:hypothetical protein
VGAEFSIAGRRYGYPSLAAAFGEYGSMFSNILRNEMLAV